MAGKLPGSVLAKCSRADKQIIGAAHMNASWKPVRRITA
jgi:hypothetical protein